TAEFKGIKVPVTLDIDPKTKNFTVSVSTPPTTELLKKEMGIVKGSQQPDKIKVANMPIEYIIKIAKIKQKSMLTDSLKAAVKAILGSCVSAGILVESRNPIEIIKEVNQGVYDDLIFKGQEVPSKEKLEKLAKDFEQVQKAQESLIKEMEKKKEEVAAATPAAPGTPAAASEAKQAEETKKEEKKK
ncbi:MAG: hypothetical protein K6T16_02005, partial [Candidatus Pacearchaeota archaeon]|nr:hypothetical protein [Candidatus Pacearchaeota archaeon]